MRSGRSSRLPVGAPASRSPGRTARRWRECRCCRSPRRPAPCRWAAASPCDGRAPSSSAPVVAPGPRRRVVQLRAGESAAAVLAPGDQHLAVGQQRRRVIRRAAVARLPVDAPGRPSPGRTARRWRDSRRCSSSPRRPAPCRWAAASPCATSRAASRTPVARPGPRRRVVQLRAGESAAAVRSPPRPAPCRWAAASPCDIARAVSKRAGRRSRSRWPGRTARRWREVPPPSYRPRRRAPCRWAAASPCDSGGAVARLPVVASRCRWPGRTAPRWRRMPPLPRPPATSTWPLGSSVAV